jgi:hypothetical protein
MKNLKTTLSPLLLFELTQIINHLRQTHPIRTTTLPHSNLFPFGQASYFYLKQQFP